MGRLGILYYMVFVGVIKMSEPACQNANGGHRRVEGTLQDIAVQVLRNRDDERVD